MGYQLPDSLKPDFLANGENLSGHVFYSVLQVLIYGTCITDVPDFRPLPYSDQGSATNNINILVSTVAGTLQIRILPGSTGANIVSGIAILEWLSQV